MRLHIERPGFRPGSVMILVMGMLAILAITISTFVTLSRINYQAAVGRNYSARMDILCHGVLQRVRVILARDLDSSQEQFDHPGWDPWLASVLPDGGNWTYVSDLELRDAGTQDGAALRAPANLPATPPPPLAGAGPFPADADGDGLVDSYLVPISGASSFPDNLRAYYAVRIVDNAQFNSRHHMKWESFRTATTEPDQTDGRIDSRAGRPRLPHVNLRGLRNWVSVTTARAPDNPDASPGPDPDAVAPEPGYDFDNNFDLWLGSDAAGSEAAFFATVGAPVTPPCGLEDDVALRTFGNDPNSSKYLQLWPTSFRITDVDPAINRVRMDARRVVSSTTRTRTLRWMRGETYGAADPLELFSPFDLRKLYDPALSPADNRTAAPAKLDRLFGWMKNRSILGPRNDAAADARRAQYLANLFEYMSADPGPVYDPISYRGRIAVTRQPYIISMLREGDTGAWPPNSMRRFAGRFGIMIHNPFDRPLSLAPYRLRFESVLGVGSPFAASAIAQSPNPLDVDLSTANINGGGPILPAFGTTLISTDNTGGNPNGIRTALQLPNALQAAGPQLIVTLWRNVDVNGVTTAIATDRIDSRAALLNGRGLDFRDWDTPGPNTTLAELVAIANNGWFNSSQSSEKAAAGVRSAIYRPMGVPTEVNPQYPAHAVAEWIGTTEQPRNSSALGAVGQPPYMTGAYNPGQVLNTLDANPVLEAAGGRFIFGYSVPVPKRGYLINVGELARVLVVGPVPGPTLNDTVTMPDLLAAASRKSRGEVAGTFGAGNSWAWMHGERDIRFDLYDPAPDDLGQPFANSRILDIVSLSHTASGQTGTFEPYRHTGNPADLDDTAEDAPTLAGNGRPAYREGLINLNTAPPVVLANLVFPRGLRTEDRVANGANVRFANDFFRYVHAGGNPVRSPSEMFLYSRYVQTRANEGAYAGNAAYDRFRFATAPNALANGWDLAVNNILTGDSALGDSDDWTCPFENDYPSGTTTAVHNPPPAWVGGVNVGYRQIGYVNDFCERDQLWAGNSNVTTVRSDTYTVYVLVKLLRFNTVGGVTTVEDAGESRVCAVLDRTVCNPPVPGGPAGRLVLPRVLAQQFTE